MPSCRALGSASSRSRIFSVSSAVAPRCSRSSPRGPNATFAFACVATAPALALAYGTTLPTLKNRDATATPSSFVFGSRATMEKVATSCAYAVVARKRKARIALRIRGDFMRKKNRAPAFTGARFRWRREFRLAGLDAAAVRVRPLVLVAEAAGADERRRGPRALVVGFVAATIEPRIAEGVGDGLTGLVANEMLLVERRVAERLATRATSPRLDRVLHVLAGAVDVVAVIRAVGQIRAAARSRRTAGRIRTARDEHFVDGVVVGRSL